MPSPVTRTIHGHIPPMGAEWSGGQGAGITGSSYSCPWPGEGKGEQREWTCDRGWGGEAEPGRGQGKVYDESHVCSPSGDGRLCREGRRPSSSCTSPVCTDHPRSCVQTLRQPPMRTSPQTHPEQQTHPQRDRNTQRRAGHSLKHRNSDGDIHRWTNPNHTNMHSLFPPPSRTRH